MIDIVFFWLVGTFFTGFGLVVGMLTGMAIGILVGMIVGYTLRTLVRLGVKVTVLLFPYPFAWLARRLGYAPVEPDYPHDCEAAAASAAAPVAATALLPAPKPDSTSEA